jgi:cellulose 1,4-beta-cellobiosidase
MYRPLMLVAAIMLLIVSWFVVVTDSRAGASLPAPGAMPADSPPPPTPTTPGTSPFPPGPPRDLHVTAVTSSSVTLAWTASTTGCCAIATYIVNRTLAFNDVVSSQDVGNVTTVTFNTDIRPASQYSFSVSARDSLGHSSASSNSVVVMTPITDSGPDSTPPSAPTNLTMTSVSPQGAALTWSPSTDNIAVTGYNVYRFDGLYISTLLATVTVTSYTAPLASGSSLNIFYVRARDAVGNLSIASNTVSGISPSTPTTSPSSSPSIPPLSCRVTYRNTSRWAGGFVADLAVTNTGQTPIAGWKLTFGFGGDQRISSAWNATFSQAGADVTLGNRDWNRDIAPGAGATAGLQGSWTTSNAAPNNFALNGVPCTTG